VEPKVVEVKKEEPKVEAKKEEVSDELPPLEEVSVAQPKEFTEQHHDVEGQGSRSEKKVRKSMEKLGMKPVKGVSLVQIIVGGVLIQIKKADVFKYGSDNYIVFGQGEQRDLKEMFSRAPQETSNLPDLSSLTKDVQKLTVKSDQKVEEGPIDETGVEQKDIELVLAQVSGATRNQAVLALQKNKGDIVNAIMSLTGI